MGFKEFPRPLISTDGGIVLMGRKSSIINLTVEEREYLETQTRARTIQAQTVNRSRILLLKADGYSIDDIADKVGVNRKSVMLCLKKYEEGHISIF